MDLNEYMRRSAETDQMGNQEEAVKLALLGIAGEAGSVVSEGKKWFRDNKLSQGLEENVREELGDLLWYVASLARRLKMDLNQVLEANLQKTREFWSSDMGPLPDYDDHNFPRQKFLRNMEVRFVEDHSGQMTIVRMEPLGELASRAQEEEQRKHKKAQLGDDLDDNSIMDDGYRYHDIIHLAHATVLGWSPVLRALMGAQRREVGEKDRVEDGARAKAIEEGLAAFVFNYLEPYDYDVKHIDWTLLKHVRRTVMDLEVSSQPLAVWRHAYEQAFTIFLQLKNNRGGQVKCDLDKRQLAFFNELQVTE
ncbi:MazG nucleotide pyrophosphohydrolase domain-containing protein [Candidatus Poriferisocius sp.]|uniref:nucleoside triphosphate pyrophosphohydrolase family protein n=1 Tax=Candidatus Poriferisocius sp. TaxID=3101276 RepID=UPI003B02CA60